AAGQPWVFYFIPGVCGESAAQNKKDSNETKRWESAGEVRPGNQIHDRGGRAAGGSVSDCFGIRIGRIEKTFVGRMAGGRSGAGVQCAVATCGQRRSGPGLDYADAVVGVAGIISGEGGGGGTLCDQADGATQTQPARPGGMRRKATF